MSSSLATKPEFKGQENKAAQGGVQIRVSQIMGTF